MPSVFPGVDPYLESQGYWQEFHTRFITNWADVLVEILPPSYEARIEEGVRLVEVRSTPPSKVVGSDIAIERRDQSVTGTAVLPQTTPATLLEAATIPFPEVIEQTERSIRIIRRPDRKLVAILELLSTTNKEEPGYSIYLDKRQAILRQYVHLVELDLLRGGKRPPLAQPYPKGDYCAVIGHADQRPNASVYTWGIRNPLPTIPIPLAAPDPPVHVNLAAVFNTAFDRAGFARSIDYSIPPTAVGKEDEEWADGIRQRALSE